MGSSPKPPKPPKVDIGRDIEQYVTALEKNLPTILSSEAEYRPQFQNLNLADVSGFVLGYENQPGLLSLSNMLAQTTQEQTRQARASDIAGLRKEATGIRLGLRAISPEQVQNVRYLEQLAEKARGAEELYAARMEP